MRWIDYEDDIPAEEEIPFQGTRIPCTYEHARRKKGTCCQKKKRQESSFRLKGRQCDLFFSMKYSDSLKKNDDFRHVYNKKKSVANRYFVMYVSENGSLRNRLGIAVSKKVGNSVVRHRITRLVRESYRLNEEKFHSGWDMVVVARSSAAGIGYKAAESALLHLGRLHGITNA